MGSAVIKFIVLYFEVDTVPLINTTRISHHSEEVQNPSWEANSHSASQEIPHLLWDMQLQNLQSAPILVIRLTSDVLVGFLWDLPNRARRAVQGPREERATSSYTIQTAKTVTPCSLVNVAHSPSTRLAPRYSEFFLVACSWYVSSERVKKSEAPTSARPVHGHCLTLRVIL